MKALKSFLIILLAMVFSTTSTAFADWGNGGGGQRRSQSGFQGQRPNPGFQGQRGLGPGPGWQGQGRRGPGPGFFPGQQGPPPGFQGRRGPSSDPRSGYIPGSRGGYGYVDGRGRRKQHHPGKQHGKPHPRFAPNKHCKDSRGRECIAKFQRNRKGERRVLLIPVNQNFDQRSYAATQIYEGDAQVYEAPYQEPPQQVQRAPRYVEAPVEYVDAPGPQSAPAPAPRKAKPAPAPKKAAPAKVAKVPCKKDCGPDVLINNGIIAQKGSVVNVVGGMKDMRAETTVGKDGIRNKLETRDPLMKGVVDILGKSVDKALSQPPQPPIVVAPAAPVVVTPSQSAPPNVILPSPPAQAAPPVVVTPPQAAPPVVVTPSPPAQSAPPVTVVPPTGNPSAPPRSQGNPTNPPAGTPIPAVHSYYSK